jgi:hypothetical protein
MWRSTRILLSCAMAVLLAAPVRAAQSIDGSSRPYGVLMTDEVPGLPHHTVYRPSDLGALRGAKMPIFVWGNGGCEDEGNRYRYFLSHIAAHGYLVVALGKIGPASRGLRHRAFRSRPSAHATGT